MATFHITIKNYRCFTDAYPARFTIDGGMVALLGPNNSGKSALLKFFQEFKDLWGGIYGMLAPSNSKLSHFSPTHTNDPNEIFNDENNRNIRITIEVPEREIHNSNPKTGEYANKLEITIKKNQGPQQPGFSIDLFIQDNHLPIVTTQPDGIIVTTNNRPINVRHFLNFIDIARQSLYIGPFRNAITTGTGNHFELAVGETFIQQWSEWQHGQEKEKNRAVASVINTIKSIMGFSDLSIMGAMNNKTLQLTIDGHVYKLNEVGSGLAQMIIVLGSALIRKPTLLLIDEPELGLHPRLQLDFVTALAKFSSYGIMFATHSVGLARSAAERIYAVKRVNRESIVTPFESTPSPLELLGELSFSTAHDMGAEALLLVEGTHDVKVMQQLLRKYGKDHRVVIIPLGGSAMARGGVETELAEFRRVHSNIYAVVDSERPGEGQPADANRQAFQKACAELGYKALLTERRATENYFSDSAIKATLGEKYRALQPYELLRNAQPSWAKHDNWRIAQAMTRAEIDATDIGQFLAGIEVAKPEGKATDSA